jgi:hypothetical protein
VSHQLLQVEFTLEEMNKEETTMSLPDTKIVDRRNCSWMNRSFQNLCGLYVRDEVTNLFFHEQMPAEHQNKIVEAFDRLSPTLRESAESLGLTINTTNSPRTLAGHESSVYGDWQRVPGRISPHLEMTRTSLSAELIVPHLAHECCHLFFALLSDPDRKEYVARAARNVSADLVEVTAYAQRFFDEWQQTLTLSDELPYVSHRRAAARQRWVLESLCETVAIMHCDHYGAIGIASGAQSSVRQALLTQRRRWIEDIIAFKDPPVI